MKLALQTINDLEREGLVGRHAIGGAMALLFHDEPVLTYDLDTPHGHYVADEPAQGSRTSGHACRE